MCVYLKKLEHGLYKEYVMVLSMVMFYLLPDACMCVYTYICICAIVFMASLQPRMLLELSYLTSNGIPEKY